MEVAWSCVVREGFDGNIDAYNSISLSSFNNLLWCELCMNLCCIGPSPSMAVPLREVFTPSISTHLKGPYLLKCHPAGTSDLGAPWVSVCVWVGGWVWVYVGVGVGVGVGV